MTCLMTLALGAFVAAAAAAEQKAAESKASSPAPGPEWKLVWSDEFDKDGPPDPAKWRHEEGFIRNHEAQYYTKRPENVRVEKGVLVIEARKEQFKNPKFQAGSQAWQASREFAEYTAGSINTKGVASWLYGRIEARLRLPDGKGQWPAFWTLGATGRWPANGEIDIMEWWGNRPAFNYSTTHYALGGKHKQTQGKAAVPNPKEDFHVYAMEWDSEKIDFFFDGAKYFTFPLEKASEGDYNPFRHAHYILLNLALGGDSGGKIDDSKFPQKYLIDYVRVYQKK